MSVIRCCVPNCDNKRGANTILHMFPNPSKELDRFNDWVVAIGGDILSLDKTTIYTLRRVCHCHFELKYQTRSKRLSSIAVPTLFLSPEVPIVSVEFGQS